MHTSDDSMLFWGQETTAGGETVYTCVANNTVATANAATANATKAITVNGTVPNHYRIITNFFLNVAPCVNQSAFMHPFYPTND